MSGKAKNIIAIVVAAVAIIAIAAVVVLSSIVIRPVSYSNGWMEDVRNVEIYHSSAEGYLIHSGGMESELLEGNGEYAALEEKYTVGDIFDMTNFSLISACLQFNYSFGLSLADMDNVNNNKMTGLEMQNVYTELTEGTALGYSFVIRLEGEPRVLELEDDHGRKCTQEYDTVMFTVNQDSDWVRNIDAYAFSWNAVFGEHSEPGTESTAQFYYRLTFGMRTAAMLDVLEGVYTYDAFPEEEEEEETGDDTTEEDTTTDGETEDTTTAE